MTIFDHFGGPGFGPFWRFLKFGSKVSSLSASSKSQFCVFLTVSGKGILKVVFVVLSILSIFGHFWPFLTPFLTYFLTLFADFCKGATYFGSFLTPDFHQNVKNPKNWSFYMTHFLCDTLFARFCKKWYPLFSAQLSIFLPWSDQKHP